MIAFDMTAHIERDVDMMRKAPERATLAPVWPDASEASADPQIFAEDRAALDEWLDARRRDPLTIPPSLPAKPFRREQRLASRLGSPPPLGGAVTEAVGDPAAWPYSTIGRLTVGFGEHVRFCTGWVTAERVVATAAHCIYRREETDARDIAEGLGDGNADWAVFEPQAVAGAAAGRWAGVKGYLLADWTQTADGGVLGESDFAFIVLDAPIAAQTGVLGLQTALEDGLVSSLGYPRKPTQDHEFDGRFLFASTGEVTGRMGGQTEAENALTEGSSGGPWLVRGVDGLAAAGLNASKPVDSDESTYSPMFGDRFLELLSMVLSDMTGV